MNADAILAETLDYVRQSGLGPEAVSDLIASVEALDRQYFELIADLLNEHANEPSDALARGLAVAFLLTTIQLADDLSDSECVYLESALRRGPATQALLHTMAFYCLLSTALPPTAVQLVLADLLAVGSAQQCEVSTQRWTLEKYLDVAQAINGRQFGAYFRILLFGFHQELDSEALGRAFGTCVHIVGDAKEHDVRWRSLPLEQKTEAGVFALAAARRALAFGVPALEPHLFYMLGYAARLSLGA